MSGSRVTLVAGPPCSGKSTYVAQHKGPGDQVLDYDEVFAEVSAAQMHDHPVQWRAAVATEFRSRLESIRGGWIIRSAPARQHRAIIRRIHGARSVVLAVPAEVCLARLMASSRPEHVKIEQAEAIARWWRQYEPSAKDVVVTE